MTTRECDGCGDDVTVAGGIGGIWSGESRPTGGMTLELVDGTEHFLCFDCIDRLPDDREVTSSDVADLATSE